MSQVRLPLPFLLVLLLSTAVAADDGNARRGNEESIAAFEQLQAAYDLHAEGDPFELRAEIHLDTGSEVIEGHLKLLWAAPDQWRESLDLGGFEQVRQVAGNRLTVQRNMGFVPPVARRVRSVLGIGLLQARYPGARFGKMRQRGDVLRCGEAKWRRYYDGRQLSSAVSFCLLADSGDLVELSSGSVLYEFQPALKIGSKRVPSAVRHSLGEGRSVLELQIAARRQEQAAELLGDLPADAETWAWCADMRSPFLTERRSYGQIRLPVSLVVQEDGQPSRIVVVGAESEADAEAYRQLVANLAFTPASCGGQPVKAELHLEPPRYTYETRTISIRRSF